MVVGEKDGWGLEDGRQVLGGDGAPRGARRSAGVCWAFGLRLAALSWALAAAAAGAQTAIYRCGNEYTNNPTPQQQRECKLIEGGGVSVVPAPKPRAAAAAPRSAPDATSQPRVPDAQQKARDNDARAILEAELRKAEAKLAELQREYNNGQPEKRTDELRNLGRYQQRVAELQADVARAEADVAGLRRELQRLGTGTR